MKRLALSATLAAASLLFLQSLPAHAEWVKGRFEFVNVNRTSARGSLVEAVASGIFARGPYVRSFSSISLGDDVDSTLGLINATARQTYVWNGPGLPFSPFAEVTLYVRGNIVGIDAQSSANCEDGALQGSAYSGGPPRYENSLPGWIPNLTAVSPTELYLDVSLHAFTSADHEPGRPRIAQASAVASVIFPDSLPIPEPATILPYLSGLGGLLMWARRRRLG
jgi:hypothetical protein